MFPKPGRVATMIAARYLPLGLPEWHAA